MRETKPSLTVGLLPRTFRESGFQPRIQKWKKPARDENFLAGFTETN